MNQDYEQIARATASHLVPLFGEQIVLQTEQALSSPPDSEQPEKYDLGLTVAVASLIVSAAQLVVGIIALRKNERGREATMNDSASREAVRRQLDEELEMPPTINSEQRAAIIDASVEEGFSTDT